ncbi:MAG: glycosyltransferase family 2 protein [Bacteroidales bacterium]|nr:glycosyltransferase family 2 protein [Bacteroidales bacterium]
MYPLVSILIPLYNAEKYFSETMESLLNQTYPNIEIIIVDDGSTDNSYEIAKKHESDNVIVIQQKNQGPGAARNKAFELSSGEYIQYLDADDLLEPNKIEIQLEVLKKYGDDTFVFGRVGEFRKTIDNVKFQNAEYHKNYDDPLEFISDYWGYGGMIQIASCLLPGKTILKVGKWNEEWILNEDGEFISRILFESKRILYEKESIVYYRKDNVNSLNSQRTRKHFESQLASYNAYFKWAKKYFDDKKIVLALAKRYSRMIYIMYPKYEDLRHIAENKILELGFNEPVALGRKSFIIMSNLLGVKNTLKVRELFRKMASAIRKVFK